MNCIKDTNSWALTNYFGHQSIPSSFNCLFCDIYFNNACPFFVEFGVGAAYCSSKGSS